MVFDLDGTLCPVGKGIAQEDVLLLKRLEDAGRTIVISSGKPTYYLTGLFRQVGLKRPVLIGENGGTFQFGIDLPPAEYYEYPHAEESKKSLRALRELIDGELGPGVWYQPNEIGLTVFPRGADEFDAIQGIVDENGVLLAGLDVYRHVDSFDIAPESINKKNGLRFLTGLLGLDASDFVAIGDGVNDVPMFEYADVSVLVGEEAAFDVDLRFDTIREALLYLCEE